MGGIEPVSCKERLQALPSAGMEPDKDSTSSYNRICKGKSIMEYFFADTQIHEHSLEK